MFPEQISTQLMFKFEDTRLKYWVEQVHCRLQW